jgi:hypothetical protein
MQMKTTLSNGALRNAAALVLLVGGVGIAVAQAPSSVPSGAPSSVPGGAMSNPSKSPGVEQKLQLTAVQKAAIFKAASEDTAKTNAPVSFHASIGAKVPPSIALAALPANAVTSAPSAKNYKYTMAQSQVVLVDPATMEVVDIISR